VSIPILRAFGRPGVAQDRQDPRVGKNSLTPAFPFILT
jgi:hypothetical protein